MSIEADLRKAVLTAALDDAQLAELVAAGDEQRFAETDVLFEEGRPADHLWILLEGEIELSRRIAGERIVMATMDSPGQWAGGINAWGTPDSSTGYRASGTALRASRCFVVPASELARLVGSWSPFSKHLIDGAFQTIQGIDAMARQRESLVALGTLAAGLAHEINNPAAALLRSLETLRSTSEYMLAALVDLAEDGVSADRFIALDRLRVEAQGRRVTDQGSLAMADREEAFGNWMEDRAVDPAWSMAAVFAQFDVGPEWFERVEAAAGGVALRPALRWISSTLGSGMLIEELTDATSRIAHLVKDVKSYSQMDRSALQVADIHEGLESTLTVVRQKLGEVDVVRDYDRSLPDVEVYAAELNQVWTNLIDNAVDAMGGAGTLRLSTRREGDDVIVEVGDTGPGMEANVLARVFEPFFTTKDVGKGTGLGLDITRRIVVDRHGGEIAFESAPGSTVARVRLPLTRS